MKSKPRLTPWQVIYSISTLLLLIGVIFLRLNPEQRVIPIQVVTMMTTALVISLMLKGGDPVVQIIRVIVPARSRLELSARIGLGLSLSGAGILVISIFAVLVFDRFWVLIPLATALYCSGLLLLRRKLLELGGAWYRWSEMGWSLWLSLLGYMWIRNPWLYQGSDWVWTLFVVYMIVIFPAAGAMIIVREEPQRSRT